MPAFDLFYVFSFSSLYHTVAASKDGLLLPLSEAFQGFLTSTRRVREGGSRSGPKKSSKNPS